MFPSVALLFPADSAGTPPVELRLSPEHVLFPHARVPGAFCLGVFDGGDGSHVVVGSAALRDVLVEFDDAMFSVDVTTNQWSRLPIDVPESTIVEVNGRFFAVAPDRMGVVAIDGTETIRLDAPGFLVLTPLGAFESQLLYSVVQPDAVGDVMASGVVSVDLGTGQLAWTVQPPPVGEDLPVPIAGSTNPSGDRIVVTHNHESGRLHTLYDSTGAVLAGWGSEGPDFAPAGSLVAGWLDDDRLVVIVVNDDGVFQAVALDPTDTSLPTESIVLNGVSEIASAHAVAGTSLLLVASSEETFVFDTAALTFDTLTRNCGVQVLGRAS